MRSPLFATTLAALCASAPAQDAHWYSRLIAPYEARRVPPVNFNNSPRLEDHIRAGILYLSLSDAIAIAIENNLDVEFERFAVPIANADLLRAKGGGLLRGISLLVSEAPTGIGGPAAPLLTAVAPTGTVTPSNFQPNLAISTPVITPTSFGNSAIATELGSLPVISVSQSGIDITGAAVLSPGPPIPLFDPALTANLAWQHQSTPELTAFISGQPTFISNTLTGGVNFTQGFSSGAQLTSGFTALEQHNNATNYILNPFTSSNLNATFTQPLLRGFGPALNRRFIHIARNNQETSDLLFRQQLLSTVYGVVRLYEDLVSLGEDLRVKEETMNLAERLYEDNRSQVQRGTLAPVELTRAEAAVASARQDLANSRGFFAQQELILKTLLSRRGTADPALRNAHISTTTPLEIPAQEPVRPAEDLVAEALRNRPELGEARLQIENAHIALRGTRNELLPELNIVATGQNTGLAGQANPLATSSTLVPAPGTIGGIGTNLEQIFTGRYPSYSIGVQLLLPIRNRIAQADVVRDEIQIRQFDIRRQQLENQIRLEVEADVVAVAQARAALDAATQARRLQEQSLRIELEKYSVGLSNTFLVIQYENFLAQARSTEVSARNVYVKTRAALDRATANILDVHGVNVSEAYRGRLTTP